MSDSSSLSGINVDYAVLNYESDYLEFLENFPECLIYFYKESNDDEWDLTCEEICNANPDVALACLDIDKVDVPVPSNIANGGFAYYKNGEIANEIPKELKL